MTQDTARQIEDEAARWVMRIDREGRSPSLDLEIEDWIGDDTRRRGALLQAEAVWALLDTGLENVQAAYRDSPTEKQNDPNEPSDQGSWLSRRGLVAGGIGALAASTLFGILNLRGHETYETGIGEVRRVPLPDGSVTSINSSSRVSVAITENSRVAELKKGEAWFQVAKDPARPFTVEAGRIRVRAVGTAFSVRRYDHGAEIMVTEGVVEAWADGAEGNRVRLVVGGRAFVADDAGIHQQVPDSGEVDRALAWRSGHIDLAGETLDQAIAELNRYNARKIVLANPELGHERLYGVFRTDDPEAFAAAVSESFNMTVSLAPSAITLTAR